MKNLNKIRITLFYSKKQIKSFNFNNIIYDIFRDQLGDSQPNILNPNETGPNPICIWESAYIQVVYGTNRLEITFKNLEGLLPVLKSKMIDLVLRGDLAVNRMGVIQVFVADNEFSDKFAEAHQIEFLSSPEFDCSWLEYKNIDSIKYNLWINYQCIKGRKVLIFDANTSSENKSIDFKTCLDKCFSICEERSKNIC